MSQLLRALKVIVSRLAIALHWYQHLGSLLSLGPSSVFPGDCHWKHARNCIPSLNAMWCLMNRITAPSWELLMLIQKTTHIKRAIQETVHQLSNLWLPHWLQSRSSSWRSCLLRQAYMAIHWVSLSKLLETETLFIYPLVCTFTCVIWDYVLTIDEEIAYIWSMKRTDFPKLLFALNRYGIAIALLFIIPCAYLISFTGSWRVNADWLSSRHDWEQPCWRQ